jgi:hypothetical protein
LADAGEQPDDAHVRAATALGDPVVLTAAIVLNPWT